VADRNEHERDEEEIERIEGPAKKTGDKRVPLIAIEELEKPNKLYPRNPIEERTIEREHDSDVDVEVVIVDLALFGAVADPLTSLLSLRERKTQSVR
jgi:hypothetical protein